ncbi:hypothetical protein MTO96_006707 [Rhipicephalus appendiculatus]
MQAAARAEDLAGQGDGAVIALGSSATSAFTLPEPAQAAQTHARLNILIMRAHWRMNPKYKSILQATSFFGAVAISPLPGGHVVYSRQG